MRLRHFLKSIRFKIAASFFVVFFGVSLIFNYFLFQSIKTSLINAFRDGARIETEGILNSVSPELDQIPVTQADQPFQIWYSNIFESQLIYERSDFPEIFSSVFVEIENTNDEGEFLPNEFIKIDTFTYSIVNRMMEEGGRVSLVLAKNNKLVYAEIESLRGNLILANAGAAALAFLFALLIADFTLKPLQNLIVKAKSVKASTKMERLPVSPANDEITQLSQTMNEMISRIEDSILHQNQFFASAAHELRTPLANMRSELEVKLQQIKSINEQSTLVSLKEEVIRLENVVQDFLLMSQLKSDSVTLNIESLRIDDLLYDILEKMNGSFLTAKLQSRINISATETALRIATDSSKLESIVYNVINNAIRYSNNVDKFLIDVNQIDNAIELKFTNKIDLSKSVLHGNNLGLWICDQLSQKLGFVFKAEKEDDLFVAKITIPINAHNSLHSRQ
uniref:HAMP domain-containing sensor histidine kinase n=3 Tax=Roseivirga sp. TaxID=1964215 RepID=UPI00404780A7